MSLYVLIDIMATEILLSARDIYHSYGDRPALSGVDVSLAGGEVVALLGPNGSGKSTLIQSLFGHLKAQGEINWFGKSLAKWSPRDLRGVLHICRNLLRFNRANWCGRY